MRLFSTKQNGFLAFVRNWLILGVFSLNAVVPAYPVFAQTPLNLPEPGMMVSRSQPFTPTILRGLVVYPDNPLKFDFVVDTGDGALTGDPLKEETVKLVKYFLASLTVPEKELWVNLSPYESDRIIPEGLDITDLGRDLLAQDYLLKQMTSSLMYPEESPGSDFWTRVYERVYQLYGTTEIPVDTFNKVWIVPDKAVVYEHPQGAFVGERHLKVMLEEDYVSLKEGLKGRPQSTGNEESVNQLTADMVRDVLIPELEKEVNEGAHFANLRQIFNSMILAAWYKKRLHESLLGQVYVDQNKVKGIDLDDPTVKEQIYQRYLQAFKQGVFNYIREDFDPNLNAPVPRKYFSGGIVPGKVSVEDLEIRSLESVSSPVIGPESSQGGLQQVTVELVENVPSGGAGRVDGGRFRQLMLSAALTLGLCAGCSDQTLTPTSSNSDLATDVQRENVQPPDQKTYWIDLIHKGSYEEVYRRAGEFIHEPFAFDVLTTAISSNPSGPFRNSSLAAIDYFQNLSSHPQALELMRLAIDFGNASQVYANFSRFLETPLGQEVIRYAVRSHPSLALSEFQGSYGLSRNPENINKFRDHLRNSDDPLLKLIGTIEASSYSARVKALMGGLVQSILDGKITLKDAASIAQDPGGQQLLKELVRIKFSIQPVGLQSVNDLIGGVSTAIKDIFLRDVQSSYLRLEKNRFIESLSFQETYQLIVFNRQGLSKEVFDALYTRFRKGLEEAADKKSAVLATHHLKQDFRRLLRVLAFFNKLPDFLSFFDATTIQSFFPEMEIRDYFYEEGTDHILRNLIVKLIMAEHLNQNAVPGSAEKEKYVRLVQQAQQEIEDYPKTAPSEFAPAAFLYMANGFQSQSFVHAKIKSVVEAVAKEDPTFGRFFFSSDRWIDYDYGLEYFLLAARQNPGDALKALAEKESVLRVLGRSEDPVAQALVAIHSLGVPQKDQSRLALLTHDLAKKELSLKQAIALTRNDFALRARLLNIRNQPKGIGHMAIDEYLTDFYLKLVRRINDLHEQADAVRFASLEGAPSSDLYSVIVDGEEEIFTSSFNGVFNRLLTQMKKEKIDGDQLLQKVQFHKFRSFLKLAAEFGRLGDFLALMDASSADSLLRKLIVGLEQEGQFLNQAVVVAEVFNVVKDEELLRKLQSYVKDELMRVQNEKHSKGIIVYSILSGMFAQKAVIDQQWFIEMSQKFGLPDLSRLDVNSLFNDSGVNVQRHFFYDDVDGKWSYEQFLRDYKNKPQWKINFEENYVRLTSQVGKRSVEIFANYPEREEAGEEAIQRIFSERRISPQVVAHRGHSYHARKTISRISQNTIIVSLGSCGGFNLVADVLSRAPAAHIFSTKGTGSNDVNNPLLSLLSQDILQEKTLDWGRFWGNLEGLTTSANFVNYVPPHRNLGVLFHKAYEQALNNTRSVQQTSSPVTQDQENSSESPAVEQNVGGIDMDAAFMNLQIKRDGEGVPLPVSQQIISSMQIYGFSPIILNIVPADAAVLGPLE